MSEQNIHIRMDGFVSDEPLMIANDGFLHCLRLYLPPSQLMPDLPGGQLQKYEPTVLIHSPKNLQGFIKHSLMSEKGRNC